jgi:malonyl-CoA decarboxylase
MVNYLYELDDIEKNHEAYAQQHTVMAAGATRRLVKGSARDVVPVAG